MKKFLPVMMSLALAGTGVATAQNQVTAVKAEAKAAKATSGLQKASKQRTVLAERRLADGVTARIVRDADGFIYRTIVKDGVEKGGRVSLKKPFKAQADFSFYEGFESHTDQLDWIPEGWTEKNAEGNVCTQEMASHNINNTWAVQDTGDGYWTDVTSDGVKEAWIHFAYKWEYTNADGEKVSGEAVPQDEWLITPEIDVKEGDGLYFLLEFDLGSVYSYDWSAREYNRSELENDMEVLISTDGGANWTSLWKVSDDICGGMTDAQMYDVMAELKYASYGLPLADYAGKKVKIAFRYTNVSKNGFSGNSAAVDAVTVGAPAAEAAYELPYGTLLAGLSSELHVYTESYALFPAYATQTWTAASNSYTNKNSWSFYDMETQDFGTPTDAAETTIDYPYTEGKAIPFPRLTASNDSSSDTYFFGQGDEEQGGMIFGGKVADILENEPIYYGNYDYQHKRMAVTNLGGDDYCFGTHTADAWGEGITQTAFGNLFYAPAAPFTVNNMVVTLGEYDADDDAEFTLDVYTVDNYGNLSAAPVATSKLKGSEISGFGFYNAVFKFDKPYTFDSIILVMVSGYANNDKVRKFAACAQAKTNDEAHNYAYMMYDLPEGKTTLLSASSALQDYSSAVLISLDGIFHVMHADDEIVDLDPVTNTAEVPLTVTGTPDLWYIVDEENLPVATEGTAYDWLKVTPVAKEDGTYAVRFSADPIEENRAKTVSISNGGGTAKIRVRQTGTNGIAAVTTATGKIYASAGTIFVEGFEGKSVSVVNAAGMTVASVSSASASQSFRVAPGFYVVKAGKSVSKLIVK